MSKYTTGDIAALCGVTVRTVQYYDTRGLLAPSELSEGGRRLYSENDLKRMKVICFLRELGLSIDSVKLLFSEKDPGSVISLLLDNQEETLRKEISDREIQLKKLSELKAGLKDAGGSSVESIGDIAYLMTNRKKLKRLRLFMAATALPLGVMQWVAIILWITKGIWWPFAVWAVLVIPYLIWAVHWYFRKMAYICPRCHTVFKPTVKEGFLCRHTTAARKLTCPHCGHKGFCVEIAAETEEKTGEQ